LNSLEGQARRAIDLYETGEFDRTIAQLSKLEESGCDQGFNLGFQALAFAGLDNSESFKRVLEEAVSGNPHGLDLVSFVGMQLEQKNEPGRALEAYQLGVDEIRRQLRNGASRESMRNEVTDLPDGGFELGFSVHQGILTRAICVTNELGSSSKEEFKRFYRSVIGEEFSGCASDRLEILWEEG
jgi:hypothetical protein